MRFNGVKCEVTLGGTLLSSSIVGVSVHYSVAVGYANIIAAKFLTANPDHQLELRRDDLIRIRGPDGSSIDYRIVGIENLDRKS